jgi:hypothetical protein
MHENLSLTTNDLEPHKELKGKLSFAFEQLKTWLVCATLCLVHIFVLPCCNASPGELKEAFLFCLLLL